MRSKINAFICVLLIFCMLVPSFSFAAGAEGSTQNLRYGKGTSSDTVLSGDALFEALFPGEASLTAYERLRLQEDQSFTFSYNTDIPTGLVSWTYDGSTGKLTVTASPYRYTAKNGETVVWIPQTVADQSGTSHPLQKSGDAYAYTYTGVWNSGSRSFTVQYGWTATVSAQTADALLTDTLSAAQAVIARESAYESAHAAWERQAELYNAYSEMESTYQRNHRRWEAQKQDYENYLLAKAAYDASVAEYQSLLAQWEAYNEYQRRLTAYTGQNAQYQAFAQTMQKVEYCLAIMERFFMPTTDGNEWRFYPSLNGETVDSVLDQRYKLITWAGIPQETLDEANDATEAIRALMAPYAAARNATYATEYEKKCALFAIYQTIYNDLRDNMGTLFAHFWSIYRDHGLVRKKIEIDSNTKDSVPHFRQFLSLMYVLQALLDDQETVNYSMKVPYEDESDGYKNPKEYKISNLVESALRMKDFNSADPVGVTLPATSVEMPVEPTPVEKPDRELPEDPSQAGAPTPVTAPGAEPQFVDANGNPVQPVAAPGAEPSLGELTNDEQELLAQYRAGNIRTRTAKGKAQTLSFTQSVTVGATFQNLRKVTFHQVNGDVLSTQTVEYNGSLQNPPTLANYQTDEYSYTFKGWIVSGSGATQPVSLTGIKQDLSLTPLFTREKRSYQITWNLGYNNQSTTTTAKYGETPSYSGTPTRPDDAAHTYTFKGWSPAVAPVTGNATYTALWESSARTFTITWDLGYNNLTTTSTVAYGKKPTYSGATPTRPNDSNNFYTFKGWSPTITAATQNTTYTAVWEATPLYYTITWKLGYNNLTETTTVEYGKVPAYSGTPTRPDDNTYFYTFKGWSPTIVAATKNTTYTAVWEATPLYYTITWNLGYNNQTQTTTAKYGSTPEYPGIPTRPDDNTYFYTFKSWSPTIVAATQNATYTAVWGATPLYYTITWNFGNGTNVTTTVKYGETPVYPGTPTRPDDDTYSYTFKNWSPTITAATQNATYTANWNTTRLYYTITWNLGYSGKTVTSQVRNGEMPEYPGIPTRPDDNTYFYTFQKWTPTITNATKDATYTAVWKAEALPVEQPKYTITWDLGYGTPTTKQVENGKVPSYGGTPTRPNDSTYSYTFKEWSPALTAATRDITYTAVWERTPLYCTVTWDLGTGNPTTTQVNYNSTPSYSGTPKRANDNTYSYEFVRWEPAIGKITQDTTYTAVWKLTRLYYTVTWDLGYGTPTTKQVENGKVPSYGGTPTRPNDSTYSYTFKEWSPALTAATRDITYTAVWERTPLYCTVTWDLGTGNPTTTQVNYNTTPSYPGTPTRANDDTYSYTFLRWEPAIGKIKQDTTYTAVWNKTKIQYTVTWDLGYGTPVKKQVEVGSVPSYGNNNPTRANDSTYSYQFVRWEPAVTVVTGNVTYTAVWEKTPLYCNVTWDLGTGNPTTSRVNYNTTPTYPGNPTRANDDTYSYKFERWEPVPANITEDATYTAVWKITPLYCNVIWDLGNGQIITDRVGYNTTPAYSGTPTRENDDTYSYEFLSWDSVLTNITEDTTYTAVWKKVPLYCNVTWDLGNGQIITDRVGYNTTPAYSGTPTRANDDTYSYEFVRWEPVPANITEDATYTAVWQSTPLYCNVTWDLGNGKQTTVRVPYGQVPAYDGTPEREDDGVYYYLFQSWDSVLAPVTGDITYQAIWKKVQLMYQITWDLGDGREIVEEWRYGETPAIRQPLKRENDATYSYTFVGWSTEPVPVDRNATYRAKWKASPLVWDEEGNSYSTEVTDREIIVDAANETLLLTGILQYAEQEDYESISLQREYETVSIQTLSMRYAAGVKWAKIPTQNKAEYSFRLELLAQNGETLPSNAEYTVSLQIAPTELLAAVYEVEGDSVREIEATSSVNTIGRLATFTAQLGKTIVYRLKYQLRYESENPYYSTTLPTYAEPGEEIVLELGCDYGYEFTGATLVYENGNREEIQNSFTMPAESVTVELGVTPIRYHVIFVCRGSVLAEGDYSFGDAIVPPEIPEQPDEGNDRFIFRGWSPELGETASGEERERTYEAVFSVVPVNKAQGADMRFWFFRTVFFKIGMIVLAVILLLVGVLIFVKKRRKKKRLNAQNNEPKT